MLYDGIEYIIQRKRIKNIRIRITPEGMIFISVPLYCREKEIKEIIEEKKKWIEKSLQEMKDKEVRKYANDLNQVIGEMYYLWGEKYKILHKYDTDEHIELSGNSLIIHAKTEETKNLKRVLINEEKRIFKEEINRIINKYQNMSKENNLFVSEVIVKKLKSSWGICMPSKHRITINDNLIKYNQKCLEYVIVHEISHLIYANHSKNFYAVIYKYFGEYKEIKKMLKQ